MTSRDPIFIPLSDHMGDESCEVCLRNDIDLIDDDAQAIGGITRVVCIDHCDEEAAILVMRHFN